MQGSKAASPPIFSAEVRPDGTLALSGELDMATAPVLEAAIAEIVSRGDDVVLDLFGLSFIGSTGIRCFFQGWRASGRRLVLRNATGQVKRVLELMEPQEAWVIDASEFV